MTGWIHGFLGKGVRIKIPDYVRGGRGEEQQIIALLAPEEVDHMYVGFQYVVGKYDSSVRTTSGKENDNPGEEQEQNHDCPTRKRVKETVVASSEKSCCHGGPC